MKAKLKRIGKGWYEYKFDGGYFIVENGSLAELYVRKNWQVTKCRASGIGEWVETVESLKEARELILASLGDKQ